ncbi:hypothetical protein RJ639_021003 [Escallonia herrerae]|uniref:Avr9/Cf-9 rapidly elicited protein 146 n=1 Tax=Escallonia herrerae TaxID=1293975 RepID=A0AA88V5I6_9ASTE|nr:hypothetical protein RJ639_021003 [Escallonia herrerae]
MEPNLPVMAKKFWSTIRVLFYMLRKGMSKRKLMLDLNMMMKRGKIAGEKALHNLMFHHHGSSSSSATSSRRSHDGHLSFPALPGEYEFSCSNSPIFPFHLMGKQRGHHHSSFFSCANLPTTDDDVATVTAVMKSLEMLNSAAASPALPGFGKSPMVRQLRVTDSPFPLGNAAGDSHVDEAAEEFILRFYNDLRLQSRTPSR